MSSEDPLLRYEQKIERLYAERDARGSAMTAVIGRLSVWLDESPDLVIPDALRAALVSAREELRAGLEFRAAEVQR